MDTEQDLEGAIEVDIGDDVVTVDTNPPADETPAQRRARERGDARPQPEVKVESDNPDESIEALKRALAEKEEQNKLLLESQERERQGRMEAERLAQESANRANQSDEAARTASLEAAQRGLDSVTNARAAAERERGALKAAMAQAWEKGDYAAAADLQDKIGTVAAQIVNYENAQAALKSQLDEQKAKPAAPAQHQPQFNETQQQQIEKWLATQVTPRTAQWIRQHPTYFTDPAFQRRVNSSHNYLVNVKNVMADSDEYFRKLEEEVGLRQPAEAAPPQRETPLSAASQTTQRKVPVSAAPPSRSVPAAPDKRPNRVTLTKEEAELAQHLFPQKKKGDPNPLEVYARNKMALQDEAERGRFTGSDR